jgi:hypothetical protein
MGKLKVRFFDYDDSDIVIIKQNGQFLEIAVDGIWESDPFLADRIEEGNTPIVAVLGLNPDYMATVELNPVVSSTDFDDHVVSVIVNSMVRHSTKETWWSEDFGWPSNFYKALEKCFVRKTIERWYEDNGQNFLDGITIYWQLK